MNASKLTIASMFVVAMAWTGVAKAEYPCGAPGEILKACEVVEEPECYDVCEPDAMLISCMADGAAECMAECAGAKSVECEAGCAGQCQAACSDGLLPGPGKQECKVSCGSDCMGGCSAACVASDDKTLCFAACSQQCSAHCEVSCSGGGKGGGKAPAPGGGKGPAPGGGKGPAPGGGKGPAPGDYDDDYGGGGFACEASCEQACAGSCAAEGARDCEIGCQAAGAASCKAELGKKCKEVCTGGGVMVCDKQYIDIDDIDHCLAELAQLGVEVHGPIEALKGEKAVLKPRSASCSVEDQAKLGLAGALFTLFSFGFGASLLRRRRR